MSFLMSTGASLTSFLNSIKLFATVISRPLPSVVLYMCYDASKGKSSNDSVIKDDS
jgi:hypothetical protein